MLTARARASGGLSVECPLGQFIPFHPFLAGGMYGSAAARTHPLRAYASPKQCCYAGALQLILPLLRLDAGGVLLLDVAGLRTAVRLSDCLDGNIRRSWTSRLVAPACRKNRPGLQARGVHLWKPSPAFSWCSRQNLLGVKYVTRKESANT